MLMNKHLLINTVIMKNNDAGSYTYNTVKNNGFEILVTTKNGKIALIQCIPENHY